jgi:transposase
VLAATGGLERAAPAALAAAGLPVVVVNPRQARDLARATGPLAKTEALAARALAHCADVIRPTPRPLPDAQTQERRALRGRRQPRSGMRTAALNRLAGTSERLTKAIAAHMTWRNAAIAPLDDDRETRLRASPRWRANADVLPSATGMGPVCAHPLRRERPALGTRTRQQIAAWVGVAPLHGARGTLRGRRTMWGGRAHGRPVFSMGTLVATRSTPQRTVFYERLLAAGNVTKVALTACMPKLLTMLNAMLKQRTPWQPQEVQN